MNFKSRCILGKLLYTIVNDLVLIGLLMLAYYLMWNLEQNLVSILLMTLFSGALFCFYFIRALTVVGDEYDNDNIVFMLFKLLFLFFNGLGLFVFFAPPAIALILFATNTILVSGTQYYRIIQLIRGKYEKHEGLVLFTNRKIEYKRRGLCTINYIVVFERDSGGTVSICVDRFTFWRLKRNKHGTLVFYQFPRGRIFGEIIPKKR